MGGGNTLLINQSFPAGGYTSGFKPAGSTIQVYIRNDSGLTTHVTLERYSLGFYNDVSTYSFNPGSSTKYMQIKKSGTHRLRFTRGPGLVQVSDFTS